MTDDVSLGRAGDRAGIESLADSETANDENEAVRARIRERFSATLRRMSPLYHFRPDDDSPADDLDP